MESKLKVVLLAHTPDPEQTVAAAAKLCYSASGVDAVMKRVESATSTLSLKSLSTWGT